MNALLLVGSPKGRDSASFRLASRLAAELRGRGAAVADAMVHRALRSEEDTARLLDAWEAAELVLLAFPLYVDALPAPVTRLLELAASRRAGAAPTPSSRRLAVVVQCGFPETFQCGTAIEICRLFALRTGMRWAGALAMGMGGAVGEEIRKTPGGGRNIVRAIGMAADALAGGGDIPAEASALFGRPLMPRWLYILGGNLGWRRLMWRNRARRPIGYRPFP